MPKKTVRLQENGISTQNVDRIHRVIRAASNINIAAARLGVGVVTLASHLSKFILDGELLSFDTFKRLSVNRAKQIWGVDYQKAMIAPVINMAAYNGVHLHEIACGSQTVREAAIKLGVMDHTLSRYLSKFSFNGHELTFRTFKKLSLAQAADVFGDAYDRFSHSQRKNLTPVMQITDDETVLSDLTTIIHNDVIEELDFQLIEVEEQSFDELASTFAGQFSSSENYGRFFSLLSSEFSSEPAVDARPPKRIRYCP